MVRLKQRVSAVEADMIVLREEWKDVAQAPLINGRLLSSLRETQVEHGQTLAEHSRMLAEQGQVLGEHSRILGEHSRMLAEHSRMLTELKTETAQINVGLKTIVNMLTTLIEREN